MQAIPRRVWLDKSRKQLIQWPIAEIERLRVNPVILPTQVIKGGSTIEIPRITAAQVNIIRFTSKLILIFVCNIYILGA